MLYLAQGDPARAVDFDETPQGHAVSFDENGDVVGLTLIDIRRRLDETQGSFGWRCPRRPAPQTSSLPWQKLRQGLAQSLNPRAG